MSFADRLHILRRRLCPILPALLCASLLPLSGGAALAQAAATQAAATQAAATQAAATQAMVFDVLRDGDKIGEHRVDFEDQDGILKVSVETAMEVNFAFVTLFRYEHKRVERWRDGELESLAGMTNDDGEETEISIVRKLGHYSRTINGVEVDEEITGPLAIDSLWRRDLLAGGKLFSVASDKVYRVRSDLLGWETIETRRGEVEAEHYKLSGEVDRDLWYGAGGELLRVSYENDKGEIFEYVRR
jgi:Domain of unknown function (DUF6134)